jgi:molybdopterin synthase catalytic subunit
VRILVRYFASAREAAGRESESVELEDGGTVGALVAHLEARHPALAAGGAGLRYALGQSFVDRDAPLGDGAEIALIPPVGGG